MRRPRSAAAVLVAAGLTGGVACGSDAPKGSCTEGTSVDCMTPFGCLGTKTCNANAGWDACVCAEQGTGGSAGTGGAHATGGRTTGGTGGLDTGGTGGRDTGGTGGLDTGGTGGATGGTGGLGTGGTGGATGGTGGLGTGGTGGLTGGTGGLGTGGTGGVTGGTGGAAGASGDAGAGGVAGVSGSAGAAGIAGASGSAGTDGGTGGSTGGTGGVSTGGTGGWVGSVCDLLTVVGTGTSGAMDDLESASTAGLQVVPNPRQADGRTGAWSWYPTPNVNVSAVVADDGTGNSALHFVAGNLGTAVYGGVTLAMLGATGAGSCYDASAYSGIRFRIMGTASADDQGLGYANTIVLSFVTAKTQTAADGGDAATAVGHYHYLVDVSGAATRWQTVQIRFNAPTIRDPGNCAALPQACTGLATDQLQALDWNVQSGQVVDIWLDDIELY
jgi:hypothetical protein